MNIQLPEHSEEFIRERAASAGFPDVSQYVLTLVEEDGRAREVERSLAGNERLERIAIEGLDCGDAGPLTKDDWSAIREEVNRHIEPREWPHGRCAQVVSVSR